MRLQSCSVAQLLQWTAGHQASLSFTVSWDLIKLMSIESITPLNPLILCCPLLLLLSVFPSIKITALYNSMKLWPIPRNLHWRREWQTTSAFVPQEPHDQCEKTKRYDTMDWTNYDSWWLGSLKLRSWQIRCMVRAHFLEYHFFAENSHGGKGKGDVLDCFYKGTNPFIRALPLDWLTSQASPWGLGFNIWILEGHTCSDLDNVYVCVC